MVLALEPSSWRDLVAFRAVERVAALGLGLVMRSSEEHAAPSAAPPQPRPGKNTRRGRTPKHPLQFATATLQSEQKASQL